MNQIEYLVLLLEEQRNVKLIGSLKMEEQGLLHQLQRNRHDIGANSKLQRVREDMAGLQGIVQVQSDLINSYVQKTYGIKFKSFKVTDHSETIQNIKDEQGEQIQKPED